MSSVKDRAIALFQKYDPAKVPKVDAILAKYAGKEEAFLKSLEKKYKEEVASKQGGDGGGASAASSPSPASATAGGGGSHKDRLIALFKKHDPEKVPKADAILAKYAGKEEAFLKQLEKKYNDSAATTPAATPRPNSGNQTPRAGGAETPRAGAGGSSYKDRLVAIFQKHDAAKIPKADAILAKYAGKEEAFLKQLEKKYESGAGGSGKNTPRSSTPNNSARTPNDPSTPTTSTAQPMTTKEKFVAIFQKHDATKVPMADAILAKHAGKEELFIKQLLKKFGETEEIFKTPAPAAAAAEKAPTPAATPRSIVTEEPHKPLSYKEQLVAILKAHAPEKVPKADAILSKYSGKEEAFLKQLEKKYENEAATHKSPTASTQPGSPTEPQEQPEQPPAPVPIQQEKTQEPEPEEPEQQEHEQEQEQLAVSGKSTPIAGGSSNVTSGATTPRNTGLTSSSEQQQQQQPQTSAAAAEQPPPSANITYQQSEEDKRKLNRLESLRLATAEKFLETRVNSDLRRNWFSLWAIAGRKRVAERIMNATKISNLPNQDALVQALAEAKMTPGSYIKMRTLRGHLGLGYDVPTPSDVNALTRYIDDTVASAIEFLTVTYPEEFNRQQEAYRAETQQLVGVLQEAQERVGEKEKEIQTLSDKLRFTQMNLEDAEKEIDNLHQANDAQVRLTNRANQQIRKLQDSLAKEQRGIPSELEQRMEQKDELAAHLHRELAAARASANKWKDQSEKMHLQLQEERDRRARAEQRVEVLSVALVPPEKLGLKSTAQHGTPAGGATPRISIAESVRNARELQHQYQHQQHHRDPSISSPGSSSSHQQQQQSSRTYQEQSRLLAAARKALITEGSATGGDVPRLLGINNSQQQQPSTSPRRDINEHDDDDDYVPPPPTTQPPATADRAGLNQTPAVQGAENNTNTNNQEQFFSPSPVAASAAARTTATEETDSPYVFCPNCETVQLTAFNGSRFSANPTDADKVAFCFSCRKTFSKIDLEKAEKNRLRAASVASAAPALRQQSIASSASTNQQLSKSRSAVARNQDKIPDALKKSVAKLQAQRLQKT